MVGTEIPRREGDERSPSASVEPGEFSPFGVEEGVGEVAGGTRDRCSVAPEIVSTL